MTDQATEARDETASLEQLRARVEQLEQLLMAGQAADRLLKVNLEAAVKQLNDLRADVDQLVKHLSHSAGYRLRDSFQCDKCASRGHAAVRIVCTVCNRESWLGWFPKEPTT
jgi:hypothetical protein